jgi:hypothetical protein
MIRDWLISNGYGEEDSITGEFSLLHNWLDGLQGGSEALDQRYHLTLAEHTYLLTVSNVIGELTGRVENIEGEIIDIVERVEDIERVIDGGELELP